MRVITSDLEFPEGPVAMPDGSIVLVELARKTVTRVSSKGKVEIVSSIGGGPNGAAIGPDGRLFVCNNGGIDWSRKTGKPRATWKLADEYTGGRIEVVDLNTGKVEVMYDRWENQILRAPNDLVFDAFGGFWFTDTGKPHPHHREHGALYYAKADGSGLRQVAYYMDSPNGIGLSPDGKTLYVAETQGGRLWSWEVTTPGEIRQMRGITPHGGQFLYGSSAYQKFDSLAISGSGRVCVATLINGGITEVWPDGSAARHHPLPDRSVTNLCFGGRDLKTLYVTLAHEGILLSLDWHEAGLQLEHQILPH